jgi:hypothetical protein
MEPVRADLLIDLEGVETGRMLELWGWLIPTSWRAWFANALGDLFLVDDSGQVHWLDIGLGELQMLAPTVADFRVLVADPENAAVWFGEELVDLLQDSGLSLQPGECYSYRTLPILGGTYDPDNFLVADVVTHFRTWGPIHEKLRDLPDGARVRFEIT